VPVGTTTAMAFGASFPGSIFGAGGFAVVCPPAAGPGEVVVALLSGDCCCWSVAVLSGFAGGGCLLHPAKTVASAKKRVSVNTRNRMISSVPENVSKLSKMRNPTTYAF
jgi:hypothetical protein